LWQLELALPSTKPTAFEMKFAFALLTAFVAAVVASPAPLVVNVGNGIVDVVKRVSPHPKRGHDQDLH
jgi:hypothetical protein